ncbi:MAG: ABC transporter permease [Actinomycetota bacterium]|nr:ABC transporter permease [Actinomycetota bacterium]
MSTYSEPEAERLSDTEFDAAEANWTVLGPGTLMSKTKGALETAGDITHFSFEALRAIPKLRLYPSEVFRQAAILIVSSGFIVWLMEFVIGLQCGLEGNYSLKQLGAPVYSGIFSAWCAIREMAPYMWGYILAAKVGCGLVAEIGSMRISDEIDALEVIGVRPMAYIVATRIVGAWIALPFLYVIGLGVMYFAEWLVVVKQLGEVSNGGYLLTFWLFQNPTDFFYSLLKIMAMGTAIIFVGCYYGYKARGGPVGVGWNTAKSMMLNMVLVHVIGMFGTQLFWGLSPNAPIAN